MKVACIGGGPAGLYLSILLKRQDPSHEITVHERNPAGATYGWGVTYWTGLLEQLYGRDPESARRIADASVRWRAGRARVAPRAGAVACAERISDPGFGIGRRELLDILARRARDLGVTVQYESEAGAGGGPLPAADLLVAADGVGSTARTRHTDHFATTATTGRNLYTWLGTPKVFDAFTFSFVETDHGWIWAYGYRYGADRSTVVIECPPAVHRGLGLHTAGEESGLARLAELFAPTLDGQPLLGRAYGSGPPKWQRFRTLAHRTWHRGNLVLLGDAAHTTHYSIGAGTALALEDAMALADALRDTPDPHTALPRYEQQRRTAVAAAQSAAHYSARWYENLPRYIGLPAHEMFALLGQRHSPLLPYLPPRLYHRLDRTADRLDLLRRAKRTLGPRLARALRG